MSFLNQMILIAFGTSTLLTIVVKSTFVLLAALGVAAIAPQVKASLRHLIFATGFALLLALPLIVTTGPSLAIEVPVAAESSVETPTVPVQRTERVDVTDQSAAASTTTTTRTSSLPSLATVLAALWGAGTFGLAVWLIIDLMRVRNLRRNGLPAGRAGDVAADIIWESGLRRNVDVMLHENIAAPFTSGWLRPAIMLPATAEKWDETELRRAIIHELEHVRRGDWPGQLAARVACAMYWFNPLVWAAWRKLCLEAERACDDAVVATSDTSSYAEQLVDLSQQMSAGPSMPLLGMAKRSDLATRVSALLDVTQQRGRTGVLAAACSAVVGALVLFSIGPITVVAQAPVAPPAPQKELKQVVLDTDPGDDEDDDDVPSRGSAKNKALFAAASKGDTASISKALADGANVNAVFDGDGTALIAAARKGRVEAIAMLIDKNADVNLGSPGDGTPLIVAAENGHIEVVKMLLEHGADINLGIPGDANPLIAAAGAGREEVVKLLLDQGADINHIEPGDENALIHASEGGHLNVVKLLVARGADINARVSAGRDPRRGTEEIRTALSMARRGKHEDVVAYLLSLGAKD